MVMKYRKYYDRINQYFKIMFKYLTDALFEIFGKIFGLMSNIIRFKMTSIKDMFMKLVGVFFVIVHLINGMIILVKVLWLDQSVRF